jgi:hypothetical protein
VKVAGSSGRRFALVKNEPVAERIGRAHFPGSPLRVLRRAGLEILVIFCAQRRAVIIQPGRLNPHGGAGTGVAMMLGQMDDAGIPRDLHIDWKIFPEPVLPINFESKKINVKLFGLRLVENAKYGYWRFHVHYWLYLVYNSFGC